jgi:hypothetical protein
MRHNWLSVLSVLATVPIFIFIFRKTTTVPIGDFATPFSTLWDDKRVKHTWTVTPTDWVSLGHPPDSTTIDLHIALKPHQENALTDALYEVSTPGHPKHVFATRKIRASAYVCHCYVSDTPHICPRNRSLTLLRRTQTR